MAAVLRAEGLRLAPAPEKADIILINTCGFIGDAKEESIAAILAACARKKSGRCRGVIVAGCLAQRYRRQLQAALPEADAFLGLDELERVGAVVRRLQRGERGIFEVADTPPRALFEPRPERALFTGGPYAYLKIAEGCNHRCAFCAIPRIRGPQRSRPVARIVREAADLLERGARELNLIAQDLTAYGRDREDGANLPALLRALGRLGGEFWIRLLYLYPDAVTAALLEEMAGAPQVCRYLDLPVQHSHPDILRAMRRAGTARVVAELPARLRAALPGIALRTTCLAGFPGETERHFEHLLDYIRGAAFDHLGVFVFSPEEGTPAASLPGQVRESEAVARRARLMRAQRAIVRRKHSELLGQTVEVLIESPAPGKSGRWIGRTRAQAPEVDGVTYVTSRGRKLKAGEIAAARITGSAGYDLLAELAL
jgi:ribosomal protein S12 methylthiotransferase